MRYGFKGITRAPLLPDKMLLRQLYILFAFRYEIVDMRHSNIPREQSDPPLPGDVGFLSWAVMLWAMLFLCKDVWLLSIYVLPSGQWLFIVFQVAFIAMNGATLTYPYIISKFLNNQKLSRKRLLLSTLAYFFISLFVNGMVYYGLYYNFCPTCYFG